MPVSLAKLTLAFAVGLAAVLLVPQPPAPMLTAVPATGAVLAAIAAIRRWQRKALLVLGAFLAGGAYGLHAAQLSLASRLPIAYEGQDARLTGIVSDLPQGDSLRTRLRIDVEQLTVAGEPAPGPRRVLLSWYGEHPTLRAGERWQLPVRLKAPRGFRNPSGFDYERWLTGEGIDATGYVRSGPAQRLAASALAAPVQRLRQAIADGLDRHLGQSDAARMVRGLAIGVTGAVSPATWRTLRETGTAHLLAISGLHVALTGVLLYALVGWSWRRLPGLPRRVPVPRTAAVAAAMGVFAYAALAGFAVPARRTALMFSVAALGAASGRETSPARLLTLAALVVLLLDPLALLASGFWLSFGAVGILLWLALGRVGRQRRDDEPVAADQAPNRQQVLWQRTRDRAAGAVRLQAAVALALTPLTLGFFGLLSPTSVPANLVAVPLLGLLAVPLTLLGVAALPLPMLAGPLLLAAQWVCAGTLALLEALRGAAPGLLWAPVPWPALAACAVGVLVLLLPRGFPGRWMGLLWCLPALLYRPPAPPIGAFTATVLDVGQGLAVVVRTRHHALVYDSGPRFSERFSAGDAIVLPELARLGVRRLDLLMLSHGDADHAGGAADIVDGIHTEGIVSGTPRQIRGVGSVEPCRDGYGWTWDEVQFRQFHPGDRLATAGDNDQSCVLMIRAAGGGSVLLTGDVELPAQRLLVDAKVLDPVDVLLAPHHGSRGALYPPLIGRLAPRQVIFSAAYRSRFGHPHPLVTAAYAAAGARLWNTAQDGALQMAVGPRGVDVTAQRARQGRWWWAGAQQPP
ncbi:DNA internalization-related competence protein ComEC/Rec2 [Immundisolibacter sp.]